MCVVGVTNQADIWLNDQSETAGLRGGTEASRRDNDAGNDRDVPRDCCAVPADAHQDTLSVQLARHLQGRRLSVSFN